MKSFKEFCLLREMPYYESPEGDMYDLELELYKDDLSGFRNKLLGILKGKKQIDKRGFTLFLKDGEDVKNFFEVREFIKNEGGEIKYIGNFNDEDLEYIFKVVGSDIECSWIEPKWKPF